jgi:hypothetical protein
VLSEPTWLKNAAAARASSRPDRSSGTSVFSTVAGAGSVAIRSISARCSAIPATSAGA